MRRIELTQGKVALVDDEDFDFLNQWKWHAIKAANIFYAGRTVNAPRVRGQRQESKVILMHRAIKCVENKDTHIDHADNDGLNNQKSNLRECTCGQNLSNRRKRINSKNTYFGVRQKKGRKNYEATIRHNGVVHYIGMFEQESEAAKAYNREAIKYKGEFAKLNNVA